MVREVLSQSAIYSSDRSRINDSHRRGIVAFVYDHEHVHIFSRLSYRHTGYNLSHPPKSSCKSARGRDMCIQYNLAFNVELRLSNKLTRLTFMLIFLELVRLLLPVTTVHDRWLDPPKSTRLVFACLLTAILHQFQLDIPPPVTPCSSLSSSCPRPYRRMK